MIQNRIKQQPQQNTRPPRTSHHTNGEASTKDSSKDFNISNETKHPRHTTSDIDEAGGMIIENVDDVSLTDFDRSSINLEHDSFVKAKLKKIVSSVIGKNKKEESKKKTKKEDNKKVYSKDELIEICQNYKEQMDQINNQKLMITQMQE